MGHPERRLVEQSVLFFIEFLIKKLDGFCIIGAHEVPRRHL